jgi:hypothetical protein
MDYLVISMAALLAAGLTLFSGFGLGTLLMPVAALFFPVPVAVALTAVVHLANNLFKVVLMGLQADGKVLLRFGLPAMLCAFAGAGMLLWLGGLGPLYTWTPAGRTLAVYPVNFVVGALVLAFAIGACMPVTARITIASRYLPLGGCISGFFGGLSGHQGAFRSMFLLRTGLDKHRFIATGAVLAAMVDVSRLLVYGATAYTSRHAEIDWRLVAVATAAAFAGSFIGKRLIRKVTLRGIRWLVAALLTVIGAGLLTGLI